MKILYIDDEPSNRTVLSGMLATAGVTMVEAGDARTGLQLLETGNYALVLMDIRMPQISGLTAIRHVRARSGSKGQIPIIVVTADLTSGIRDLCRDAGANEFLAKPVAMDQLFAAIGTAIASSGSYEIH